MGDKRNKGCSREMADKIVKLLMTEVYKGTALCYGQVSVPGKLLDPAEEPVREKLPKGRKGTKLTRKLVEYVHSLRGMDVEDVIAMVANEMGVILSTSSVYKAWRLKLDEEK